MSRTTAATLLALLGLCACQPNHDLAVANGPLFALNPGRWTPTPQDLQLAASKAGEVPAAAPASPLDVGPRVPTPALSAASPTELHR